MSAKGPGVRRSGGCAVKASEADLEEIESPQAIMELASGFMRSRAFLTACELDLFTAMTKGERTSADVARDLGADPRATDRLMNALCVLGLLRKRAGLFEIRRQPPGS